MEASLVEKANTTIIVTKITGTSKVLAFIILFELNLFTIIAVKINEPINI